MPASCDRPPEGWRCSRAPGHRGPCAARQERPTIAQLVRKHQDELDRVSAELDGGIRSATHYDDLERRTREAARGLIDAFRKGRA
jgi:hypothetical protein